MVHQVKLKPLTNIESFSLTEKFTHKMAMWDHSEVHPKLMSLASRVVGFSCSAFVSLGDFFLHTSLTLGKSVAAVSVLAFRCWVPISPDFDLSSPLVHLTRSIHSLFNIALLPFLCFFNPERAYRVTQLGRKDSTAPHFPGLRDIRALKQNNPPSPTSDELEEEIKLLKEMLNKRDHEIEKLKQKIKESEPVENDKLPEASPTPIVIAKKEPSGEEPTIQNPFVLGPSKEAELVKEIPVPFVPQKKEEPTETIAQLAVNIPVLIPDNKEPLKDVGIVAPQKKEEPEQPPEEEKIEKDPPLLVQKPIVVDIPNAPPLNLEPPLEIPKEPLYKGVQAIFDDLEKDVANPEKPQDLEWFHSEQGRQEVKDAHDALMDAIKKFDRFKDKKNNHDPLKQKDGLRLKLSQKHIRRVDLLFNRRSQNGLQTIVRHIKNILEFCEEALESKKPKIEIEDLNQSTFDMARSILQNVQHADNLSEGLKNTIDYLENYLEYIKPLLKNLADEQKLKKVKEDQALEIKKQEEDLKIQEQKKLEKEAFLNTLTLFKGKKFPEDKDVTDIEDEICKANLIAQKKIEKKLTDLSDDQTLKNKVRIVTITDLLNRLQYIKEKVSSSDKFYELYKSSDDCKFLQSVVEWLNKQEYAAVQFKKA